MTRRIVPKARQLPRFDVPNLEEIREIQSFLCDSQHQRFARTAGDEAWIRFYPICDRLLRRFAHSSHVHPEDVDDCVQSAWIAILLAMPKYKDCGEPTKFFAW